MKGRPPKPSKLKQLEGNPGKRPINDKEPQPARKLPRCPSTLSPTARREWRRIAHDLFEAGLLTGVDHATLEAYCVAYGRWIDAEEKVKKLGELVKTANGNIIQNPALAIANRAMDQMTRLAAEFGMTPSARSRLHVEQKEPLESLADVLFAGINEAEL